MTIVDQIKEAVMEGRDGDVSALTKQALAAGVSAGDLSDKALIAAMTVVGERFRTREIFLPEVLLAARAMNAGLQALKPHLEGGRVAGRGTVIMGTVEGDIHDIGKNLVSIMLRGAGFEVVDLGNNVPAAKFVEAAREHEACVVGMSALLTTTMPGMGRVISALRESGQDRVKVIAGGAPVSQAFADEIGADGYGPNAAGAVEVIKRCVP
jgi:corrinoid protein of di/trimethylamine methyltransferase